MEVKPLGQLYTSLPSPNNVEGSKMQPDNIMIPINIEQVGGGDDFNRCC